MEKSEKFYQLCGQSIKDRSDKISMELLNFQREKISLIIFIQNKRNKKVNRRKKKLQLLITFGSQSHVHAYADSFNISFIVWRGCVYRGLLSIFILVIFYFWYGIKISFSVRSFSAFWRATSGKSQVFVFSFWIIKLAHNNQIVGNLARLAMQSDKTCVVPEIHNIDNGFQRI